VFDWFVVAHVSDGVGVGDYASIQLLQNVLALVWHDVVAACLCDEASSVAPTGGPTGAHASDAAARAQAGEGGDDAVADEAAGRAAGAGRALPEALPELLAEVVFVVDASTDVGELDDSSTQKK